MSGGTAFVLGAATGVVSVYFVAKLLRPTIRERLADISADNIARAAQGAGIPASIIPAREVMKRTLLYPAIDDALNAAWL